MNDTFTRIKRFNTGCDEDHDHRNHEHRGHNKPQGARKTGKILDNGFVKMKIGGNKKQGIFISVTSIKTGETLLKE